MRRMAQRSLPGGGVKDVLAWLGASLALAGLGGCESYQRAETETGDVLEAPEVEPRCFDDAHTIVVGPEPGCASIEIVGMRALATTSVLP